MTMMQYTWETAETTYHLAVHVGGDLKSRWLDDVYIESVDVVNVTTDTELRRPPTADERVDVPRRFLDWLASRPDEEESILLRTLGI